MYTYEWFCTGMRTDVDLQVCLLVEALITSRHVALVSLPRLLTRPDVLFLFGYQQSTRSSSTANIPCWAVVVVANQAAWPGLLS